MQTGDPFFNFTGKVNKYVIKVLVAIMTISLILGCMHLIGVILAEMATPTPFYFLLDLKNLLYIFNLALIIAVGYELIKSLVLIATADKIPSLPIIQIAIVAVANKIITLDIKVANPVLVFSLASLILGLGAAHFFLSQKSKKDTE